MKKTLNIVVILILIALIATVFISARNIGYKKAESKYESMIDSINAIAAAIPDTIWQYDTIHPDPVIKWRDPKTPDPVPVDSARNFYSDSLVNDQLAIYIEDTISGTLLNRQIGYKLFVPLQVTNTITVTEKVPVIVKQPYERQRELYGGMLMPYNNGKVGFGLSADMITKKQKIVGVQYMTIDSRSIVVGKIGLNF